MVVIWPKSFKNSEVISISIPTQEKQVLASAIGQV